MLELIALWLTFGFLSIGLTGMHFAAMINASKKQWQLKIDVNYTPKVTILIPTYNESAIIYYKLINISKLDYPKKLIQLIIIDSKSSDSTLEKVNNFIQQNSEISIQVLTENTRSGKSTALNLALNYVQGEIVVVSDADCLYPSDILKKSLPYLSDPKVGAISGPKLILNSNSSKTAQNEKNYLASMNKAKLGESKYGFTPLFEGGFSAYRREVLNSFDPYRTGSDDCGTVIKLAENSYNALFVPEAAFYTTFPTNKIERFNIKIRRANQLIRLFSRYLALYIKGRIAISSRVILTNAIIYLFSPFFFILFTATTIGLLFYYPYLALVSIVLLIPVARSLSIEVLRNYCTLIVSAFSVILKRDFLIWKQPSDRELFTKEMLEQNNLI